MLNKEIRNSVAIVRMEHGKVNAIDSELFTAFNKELDELKESDARAVILTGTGKAFSAGVDLFRVLDSEKSYLQQFLPLFSEVLKKLFLFPKPVIAALNGHAIAGGCILAFACDYRLMIAESASIGVTEVRVGVPFPALALEVVRFAVGPRYLQQVVYSGRTYTPKEALEMGFIDELVSAGRLMDRAYEVAESLSQIPADSFRMTKFQLRGHRMPSGQEILDVWSSPDIHSVIRSYLQKTIGQKK